MRRENRMESGNRMLPRLMAPRAAVVVSLLALGACNAIADIREPILDTDMESGGEEGSQVHGQACGVLADCLVEVPACRTAIACDEGECVFEDALEGTLLPDQTASDCAEIICDGRGGAKTVLVEADIEDDGNPCTEDVCVGAEPAHTPLLQVACYTGPLGTEKVGACKAGVQKCDAQGMPTGGCLEEVLPVTETCESALDDDCDGLANEEGFGCECEPGAIVVCYSGAEDTAGVGVCHAGYQICNADGLGFGPCLGDQLPAAETCDAGKADEDCDGNVNEEGVDCACGDGFVSAGEACDDGNADPTDGCTTACELPVCGDGFAQPELGEECDDGNQDETDLCLSSCNPGTCGDGFVQPALGESCDDANLDDQDACPNNCQHRVLEVATGWEHTCARLSGGIVKCWGRNSYGQLGIGDVWTRGYDPIHMGANLPALDLGKDKTAQAISAGSYHTCALLNDGSVKCWGHNYDGQLGLGDMDARGDGAEEMGDQLPSANLGTGDTSLLIRTGGGHTCAVLQSGRLKCWGSNNYGQLGLGAPGNRGDQADEMGDSLPTVRLVSDLF